MRGRAALERPGGGGGGKGGRSPSRRSAALRPRCACCFMCATYARDDVLLGGQVRPAVGAAKDVRRVEELAVDKPHRAACRRRCVGNTARVWQHRRGTAAVCDAASLARAACIPSRREDAGTREGGGEGGGRGEGGGEGREMRRGGEWGDARAVRGRGEPAEPTWTVPVRASALRPGARRSGRTRRPDEGGRRRRGQGSRGRSRGRRRRRKQRHRRGRAESRKVNNRRRSPRTYQGGDPFA